MKVRIVLDTESLDRTLRYNVNHEIGNTLHSQADIYEYCLKWSNRLKRSYPVTDAERKAIAFNISQRYGLPQGGE